MEKKRLFIVIGSLTGILLLSIGIPLLLLGDSDPEQAFSAAIPGDDPARPNPTLVITQAPVVSIPENNCTYPLEFWRERPSEWPEHVTVGEIVYPREEMLEIFLDTGEDPANKLLKNLYTTFLNILHGADMTSVEEVITDANTWLSINPPGSLLSEFNLRRGAELTSLLEGYNNGVFGPGACQDIPLTGDLIAEGEAEETPALALLITDTAETGNDAGDGVVIQHTPVPTIVVQTVQVSTPTSLPEQTSPPPPPAPTSTPEPILSLPTITPTPTEPPPPANTPVSTLAPSNTPLPTNTPVPTLAPSNTPLPTNTPVSTLRLTNTPLPTSTPVPTQPLPSPTQPPNSVCTGTIGAVTLDELIVPSGASCTLNGTRIEGNIDVGGGATLVANSISATGNLRGRSASRVEVLSGSYIGGNLRVEYGGSARVAGSSINGNLTLESNGSSLEVSGNQVGGNVEVEENTGGVSILNNYISGNLKCEDNSPPPTGGGNTVGGNAEEQCAGLN